jgi:hypothetical protein
MKYRAIFAASIAALTLAACGDEKTVTVTQPATTGQAQPTTPAPVDEQFFSPDDVASGYMDFVNENAETSGNLYRVEVMTCEHLGDNQYDCVAEWSNNSVLSATVTVSQDGSFIADNVQILEGDVPSVQS